MEVPVISQHRLYGITEDPVLVAISGTRDGVAHLAPENNKIIHTTISRDKVTMQVSVNNRQVSVSPSLANKLRAVPPDRVDEVRKLIESHVPLPPKPTPKPKPKRERPDPPQPPPPKLKPKKKVLKPKPKPKHEVPPTVRARKQMVIRRKK
jgi:outer membrane biosynthesis protein TonB